MSTLPSFVSFMLCQHSYILLETSQTGLPVTGRKIAETTRPLSHSDAAGSASQPVRAAFYSLLRRQGGYALHLRASWSPDAPRPSRLLDAVPGQPGVFGKVVLFDGPDYLPGFFAAAGLPPADLADLLAAAARRDAPCRTLRRRLGRERPELFEAKAPPREYDARSPQDRWPAHKPQVRLASDAESAGRPRPGPMLMLLGLVLLALVGHVLLWQEPAALTGQAFVQDVGLGDKAVHLLMAFALTAGLCAWTRDALLALPAAGLVVLLGLGLEICQELFLDGFISSRDIVANDLGSACALLARLSLDAFKG